MFYLTRIFINKLSHCGLTQSKYIEIGIWDTQAEEKCPSWDTFDIFFQPICFILMVLHFYYRYIKNCTGFLKIQKDLFPAVF